MKPASIMFNAILREAGLPPNDVRLIRHKDNRAERGRTPYELWRDDRQKFDLYQHTQSISNRRKLTAPWWAVFVVNFNDETMFVGMYSARYGGLLDKDMPKPHMDGVDAAGSCDVYVLELQEPLRDLIGKLFIDWGPGALAWVQYADRHDKPVIELRPSFQERAFPGFLGFIEPLSRLERIPTSWVQAFRSTRGVYLLTCPRTGERYVGSATGEEGFWGRWQDYIRTGHGGNEELRSRDPSDYEVSVLEVAGTSATLTEILEMEGRWQRKLRSELNRNSAGGRTMLSRGRPAGKALTGSRT